MGKYMRKCRGAAGGGKAAPAAVGHRAPVALGVCTRSRAAASDDARRKRKQTAATVEDALLGRDGGGDAAVGCYLHLRSRRLFMPASAKVEGLRGQRAVEAEAEASTARQADSGRSVEDGFVAAEVSRCSSTASTAVDVAARERSGDDAEVCESRDVESSVSDSECGGRRVRRETTPSSRSPVDSSDPESSKATDEQKRKRRRYPAATATFRLDMEAPRPPRTPPAAEIEEFFAAAEKAQAVRFAAKYNFDVARGVPLNAGRFEWSPMATV